MCEVGSSEKVWKSELVKRVESDRNPVCNVSAVCYSTKVTNCSVLVVKRRVVKKEEEGQ